MGFPTKKRKWKLFEPDSKEPFTVSRSKIDLFVQCPRCFYMDARFGISRPKGPSFTLNNAVDTLLKKEFDIHRAKQTTHPLMKAYGIDAVPFSHERMDEWRNALSQGIATFHKPSNFYVRGGIDDVWVNPDGELIIVDYKATSKEGKITLDDEWKVQYKRQMEIYQWLFRQNGFRVSNTGYFVYVNGKTDRKAFDGKLEFDVAVIPYEGETSWIEQTLLDMKECLMDTLPDHSADCEVCTYYDLVKEEIEKPTKSAPVVVEKVKEKVKKVRKSVAKPKGTDPTQKLFR